MNEHNNMPDWLPKYHHAKSQGACFDFSQRTQIRVNGKDRQSLLHNLSTNAVRNLVAGQGCEVFLTNIQAKVLAHLFVFVGEDDVVLEGAAGQAEVVLAHLDRYTVREDAVATDISASRKQWLLFGEKLVAKGISADQGPVSLPPVLHHISVTIAGQPAIARRHPWLGEDGVVIDCAAEDWARIGSCLETSFEVSDDPSVLEALRIEAGMPLFGMDITAQHLAQEVARDKTAISYTKGCYLGQETIARIDALGHVNRLLCQLTFDSETIPVAGLELKREGHVVGQVTSATYSPQFGRPLAFAYLKRGCEAEETQLGSQLGIATVVDIFAKGGR
jgi:folate-binding protein YgfZ